MENQMDPIESVAQQMEQRLLDQQASAKPAAEIPNMFRDSSCPDCDGLLWIQEENGSRQCACVKRRKIERKLLEIPERFRGCTFQNYVPTTELQRRALEEMIANPLGSYFLYGSYGHGKTHLLYAQHRHLVEEDIPCEVRTIVPLLGELQRARIDNEYFSKVTETARNANEFHLSIDDIDKFKGTDFKDQELGELFDLIYRRNLRLTVTSNLALEGLVESDRVLSSIVRRIDEICIALPF